MIGIIVPPLSCLISANNVGSALPSASVMIASGCAATIFAASVLNVVACRSSVSLATSCSPALAIEAIAGWMNV